MPYYQVIIAKKSGKTRWAFAFDLSKKRVVEEIITPFTHLEPFMCGRSPIEPSDVDHIRISVTEESSSQILAKTKWKRLGERLIGGFREKRRDYPEEWYIIKAGKDVTGDLIKGFSLSEEVSRTFVAMEKVFIVHGRDTEPVKELKAMLSEFGLNPIVLHELPSGSMTIIEKLEKYSKDVGFAFAVLTPDDVGFELNRFQSLLRTATFEHDQKRWFLEETITHELKPRTRQNVLLEFGFFMGKLNRSKVCCLYKGNVDLPSDMQGIVYIHFNNSVNEVRGKIIKELKAAGYEIRI